MNDKALEMLGDLPDFPGKRAPKNRPLNQKYRDNIVTDRLNGAKGKSYRVNGEDVLFFSIGELAKALGRSPVTIRMWESSGWLPKATYRTPKPKGEQIPNKIVQGRRLYSLEQVEFLLAALEQYRLNTASPQWDEFRKHIKQNYPK